MPAKWQRWMPLEIDALRASPAVQAMHPTARAGYIWLLLDAWQTDDCTLPDDPLQLAEKSGLGDELWALHGPRIMRKFDPVPPSGRLQNGPQLERWNHAKSIYDRNHVDAEEVRRKRAEAGRKGNEKRWSGRKPPPDAIGEIANASQMREVLSQTDRSTETETVTETNTKTKEQEQKPSPKPRKRSSGDKMKHSDDPRHIACKEEIWAYYRAYNSGEDPDWDGQEGKALAMYLSANPKRTAVGVRKLLSQRALSEVNHASRPGSWIRRLNDYRNGPLNEFNKPLKPNGGNGNGTQFASKQQRTEQALNGFLARQEEEDRLGAGGNGDSAGRGVERGSSDSFLGTVIEGTR